MPCTKNTADPQPAPAQRIFISYSHDSEEHREKVLGLANALLVNHVDVILDQFETSPPQDWPRWCEEQLRPENSDKVLMVCTDNYRNRVERRVPPHEGKGVCWEARFIYGYIYDDKANHRFIPVLFPGGSEDDIPRIIKHHQHYRVASCQLPGDTGIESLLREVLGKPAVVKPPLGSEPELLPKPLPYGAGAVTSATHSQPSNLPYPSLGTLFKGRAQFLTDLHRSLHGDHAPATVITTRQAVHGLGGIGKTRLAVEYALAHQAEYSAFLFAIADTPEALRRNLAALCGPLVLDLPAQHAREDEARLNAVLRWLHEHPGWFLIFDNVDSPAAAAEVERLLASLQGGHVLITSRLSDWSGSVQPLELDVLAAPDAADFLLQRTQGKRPRPPPIPPTPSRWRRNLMGWPSRSNKPARSSPRSIVRWAITAAAGASGSRRSASGTTRP